MPPYTPNHVTFQVVRHVQSLADRRNQQERGPSENSQLDSEKRRVSIQAGERYSSQGGSSVASTIQGQISTTHHR